MLDVRPESNKSLGQGGNKLEIILLWNLKKQDIELQTVIK
jgi:hypothetical protein